MPELPDVEVYREAIAVRVRGEPLLKIRLASPFLLRTVDPPLAAGGEFPEDVTAFREGMAVHGRHRQPCPDCGAPVQRIVRAENEATTARGARPAAGSSRVEESRSGSTSTAGSGLGWRRPVKRGAGQSQFNRLN